MCGTCGCGDDEHITYRKPGQGHSGHHHNHEHTHHHGNTEHSHVHTHEHAHEGHHHHAEDDNAHAHAFHADGYDHHHNHEHDHGHGHSHGEEGHTHTIQLERNILSKNDLIAERNRGFFDALDVLALNLVSSPGSGKTSILEQTIREIGASVQAVVIEGDQQTMNDAERIKSAGAPVIQVNTGNGCHLDALMVSKAAKALELKQHSTLFIENVGNLVCPSLFDLGESKRVVIISVTEGDDKPAKYPTMFASAQLCLINKIDLLPYVDFDVEKAKTCALKVNPGLEFISLSAKTGEGMNDWYGWVKQLKKS
ncbi:MAG: hydrogenase nickel incorporation protein HypB [Bacteroidales bacterium]|nr:hydrogenase nickel incorporation protein HypB [Bacteroidales bacterium]